MAPFDAPRRDDPVEMLRGLTMAFMVMLSKQPNMCYEITHELICSFPFDEYKLSAIEDDVTGNKTFMLILEDEGALH